MLTPLLVFPGEMLMIMLNKCVEGLDNPVRLVPVLVACGRRHAGYKVEAEHYDSVGAALLWTLERYLGQEWTDEVKAAWLWVYKLIVRYGRVTSYVWRVCVSVCV